MKMKKTVCLLCAAVMSLGLFAGCQSGGDSSASGSSSGSTNASAADFDANQSINVITRESGSGTRGAFIELFGIEEKDADGNKVDKTTEEASVQSSTNAVLTTVAGDETAIGYISLGDVYKRQRLRLPKRSLQTFTVKCRFRWATATAVPPAWTRWSTTKAVKLTLP